MQANIYPYSSTWAKAADKQLMERRVLMTVLVALDLLMVGFGFFMAYIIRFEIQPVWFYQSNTPQFQFYQGIALTLIPLWLGVFWMFGLYDFKNIFQGMREYAHIFNACTLGIMVVIFFTFFDDKFIVARGWVVMAWLLISFAAMLGRFIFRRVVQRLRMSGRLLTNMLVVGTDAEALAIARQLQTNGKAGVTVVGFVDDGTFRAGKELVDGVPVVGRLENLARLVNRYGAQEIVVSATALPREALIDLFQTFGVSNDITIRLSSGLYEVITTGVEVQEIGNVPLLSVNRVRLTGADVVLKRALDFTVSAALLLLGLPFLVLLGIIVKLDSSGPIIYKRRVVGVGGKLLDAFKFRTMYVDGDQRLAQHPELVKELEETGKLKNDPRITRVGSILRRASLDELPQLFNVLLGQMSLVGPRMITQTERARYGKWRTNLVTVKPGMTGLWQVSGRSDLSYEKRVTLDMHYIRNYSLWFDLYLLWQTIPAVLKKRGAY